ncbi:MAG: hypothetical protein ACPGPF_01795, partial [Pontibacterium sp.]
KMQYKNSLKSNPISVRHALELSVNHAKAKHNLSVDRIADLMGEASTSTVYKWLESGRMPVLKVRAFENVCGVDYVTRYLAHSNNKLIIDMPTGRKAQNKELNDLSVAAHQALGMLIGFYDGHATADETINALTVLMEDIAHQHGNVAKHQQPELSLGDS